MSDHRQKNIAVLQMLACAALWSIAGIFIKLIQHVTSPLSAFEPKDKPLTDKQD